MEDSWIHNRPEKDDRKMTESCILKQLRGKRLPSRPKNLDDIVLSLVCPRLHPLWGEGASVVSGFASESQLCALSMRTRDTGAQEVVKTETRTDRAPVELIAIELYFPELIQIRVLGLDTEPLYCARRQKPRP